VVGCVGASAEGSRQTPPKFCTWVSDTTTLGSSIIIRLCLIETWGSFNQVGRLNYLSRTKNIQFSTNIYLFLFYLNFLIFICFDIKFLKNIRNLQIVISVFFSRKRVQSVRLTLNTLTIRLNSTQLRAEFSWVHLSLIGRSELGFTEGQQSQIWLCGEVSGLTVFVWSC